MLSSRSARCWPTWSTQTEVNRNYQKSDLLQIIRILKNYDFSRSRSWSCSRPSAEKPGEMERRSSEAMQRDAARDCGTVEGVVVIHPIEGPQDRLHERDPSPRPSPL